MCLFGSLLASLETPFYLIHFHCLCFSFDADIINIRLVICFPKYFMQCVYILLSAIGF